MRNTTQARDWDAEADAWIEQNPEGYAMFKRFAMEAARIGRPFGMKFLAERVRWETRFHHDSADEFKINNNHVTQIGRRLVADCPELKSLVRFRGENRN